MQPPAQALVFAGLPSPVFRAYFRVSGLYGNGTRQPDLLAGEIACPCQRLDAGCAGLVEGAADSPALVSYCHKPDDTIRELEELGIIFHFSADSYGNHFEANFTDPAGFPIIVADVADLPKGIFLDSSPLQELSLPSVNLLSDSINFWLSLGFEVKPCGAQPHPWVVLTNGNMTIGIHQDQRWSVAGLCFDQHKCLFTGERIELDIKVYEKLSIGQTPDGCRIYTLG